MVILSADYDVVTEYFSQIRHAVTKSFCNNYDVVMNKSVCI